MSASATLGRSRLFRLLSHWSSPGTQVAGGDIAQQWAAWLDPLQAVRLRSGLDAIDVTPVPPASVLPAPTLQALFAETRRVQAAWAVAVDPVALQPESEAALAAVEALWPGHAALSGFERYRRVHLEWQRQMAAMVTPLRQQVRRTLARAGGRWQRLALLDALLESQFESQEARALGQVPAWLERRYEQAGAQGDASLKLFFADWQALVDAELELRLQPVLGLLDSWEQEHP